jgi:hypothetical protein
VYNNREMCAVVAIAFFQTQMHIMFRERVDESEREKLIEGEGGDAVRASRGAAEVLYYVYIV